MAACRPYYFDPDWYRASYPDIIQSGVNPLRHYLRHGRREGRMPCFLTAPWRERDLRWDLLEHGSDTLEALTRDGSAADQLWARLACARRSAQQGDWIRAATWLRPLDPAQELIGGFCQLDPALLAIEVAVRTEDLDQAAMLWRLAKRALGASTDLHLAAANLIAARRGLGPSWERHLAWLFARYGLPGVALVSEDENTTRDAFDRLRARRPLWSHNIGPLVSVMMPAYNAAQTIETALLSLSAQSWRNLEILVIDNGSTDTTTEIVQRLIQQDPRIQLLDGSAEPGAYPARNIGLASAQGAFITLLDADDWAHPVRIARQVRALMQAPEKAASVSHWVRTEPDLSFTRWWGDSGLIHRNASSLLIRAELRDRLGYWDRARAGADSEYYARIRAVYGAQTITEVSPGLPLSFGRVSATSLTQSRATAITSQYQGPRRDYDRAGRRWHARLPESKALPLPQYPERRPFPIPSELALSDAAAAVEPDAGLFDDRWYMQTYPDLRTRDLDGFVHYHSQGEAEGRDPGPGFSSSGYRMAQGLAPEISALDHYVSQGRDQGAAPLPVWKGALPPAAPGRQLLFFGHQANERIFGAERSLLDMLDRAIKSGFTPSVVMPRMMNADYLSALQARAHRVHVVPYGWIFGGVAPHPKTVELLSTLIRESGAIEVHQNTLVMDAPLRAARALGVPSVVHVRELPAEDPLLCMDLGVSAPELRQHVLHHATRFIANSQAVAHWLDVPDIRVAILPNTVDPALADLPFAPATPPRVALIGSLSTKKGLTDVLSIARQFANRPDFVEFVLIGPDSPELQAISLPANTRYLGYRHNPVAALVEADIVLSLSHFAESFGRTVLEAMTAGRPVICYDRGTPPDLLGNAGAGQVVPPDDPAAVGRALEHILTTPDQLLRMSEAARKRAAILRHQVEMIPDQTLFKVGATEE